jgi:molybdate/tungstate transport system substrate-binding protein
MNPAIRLALSTCGFLIGASMAVSGGQTAEPTDLTVFAVCALAVPFKAVSAIFGNQNPNVTVQAQLGGSAMMAKKITDLHQGAGLLAVADYSVIPKYMFGNSPHAAWYVGLRAQHDYLRLHQQKQIRGRD